LLQETDRAGRSGDGEVQRPAPPRGGVYSLGGLPHRRARVLLRLRQRQPLRPAPLPKPGTMLLVLGGLAAGARSVQRGLRIG
jgi:hypothetical protein